MQVTLFWICCWIVYRFLSNVSFNLRIIKSLYPDDNQQALKSFWEYRQPSKIAIERFKSHPNMKTFQWNIDILWHKSKENELNPFTTRDIIPPSPLTIRVHILQWYTTTIWRSVKQMPVRLSTTVSKIASLLNSTNASLITEFYQLYFIKYIEWILYRNPMHFSETYFITKLSNFGLR